uniref:Maintenance of Photosystem II under High light 2 C-terminal domain-containing protein n=1 Tax=Nelumbo nucifera TaxID=4432 RepID=A0A822ZKA4_NELNU|nr:TPA_asm: hypothetical protein HUJ06_003170 [Nelumbo nucifera]
MATTFLSANTFGPSLRSYSSSSSSSSLTPSICVCSHKYNPKKPNSLTVAFCKTGSESQRPCPILTRRSLAIYLTTTLTLSLSGKDCFSNAYAAVLEADDDEELLERVKRDRKKRLERQGVINSFDKEKASLQDLVYKLSKVGQAIENNDLPTASSVLGSSTDSDWVKKVNVAFTKLSSSPEEKTEVDTFNSSLASLISSVRIT